MTAGQVSEPSLSELGRTLERIEREFGRRLDEMAAMFSSAVKSEVYEAHRQAMADQIAAAVAEVAELRSELTEEKRERRADRRLYISALLSLLVVVAGAFLIAAFGLK